MIAGNYFFNNMTNINEDSCSIAQNGILNSWINIHDESGETLEHFHNHTDFVVTAYISLPKDTGYIEFRDPLEYHRANTWIEPELQLWKSVPCETNDVLIFPGWLKLKKALLIR